MAFTGKWNKCGIEGADAFFTACGISDEMRAAAESLISTEVEESGDNFVFKKTYGNGAVSETKFTLGAESDFEGPTGPVKAVVSRSGDALSASVGAISAGIAIDGGKLVESWTAGGVTFKRISSK